MAWVIALTSALVACAVEPTLPSPDCSADRCASAADRDALLAQIAEHHDAIAAYVRAAATPRGTLAGDYRDVLNGVGAELGCDVASQRSFVVLSNDAFLPKTVFARCADDAQNASRFFLALPAIGVGDDVEPQFLHMSAWDADAARYRIYATHPSPDGEMNVNVSPTFCLDCHGGPQRLDTWQPLMNEMTNPWSGWNAEPGFASQLFDEYLDETIAAGPTYQRVTAPNLLESASELEPIVRAGIDRVTAARVKQRSNAADVDAALRLLRPMFCDESVNYVSEIHDSGELRTATVIDDAFRSLYLSIRPDWPWAWANDTALFVREPMFDDAPLTLIPVRGESTLQAELALVSRRVLTPHQALRVRALDWARPVFSEFRCSLYEQGRARIDAGALDEALTALPADATIADVVPLAYDELMRVEVDGALRSLAPADATSVIAIADVDRPEAIAMLARGDWAAAELALDDLGDALDAAVRSTSREQLLQARHTRGCVATIQLPTAPIMPALECD